VLFTGEMVFPWMFEEVGGLALVARVLGGALALRADWLVSDDIKCRV
jgi:hypothetical protein